MCQNRTEFLLATFRRARDGLGFHLVSEVPFSFRDFVFLRPTPPDFNKFRLTPPKPKRVPSDGGDTGMAGMAAAIPGIFGKR